MSVKPVKPICIPPRRDTWKLKDGDMQEEEFEQRVTMKCKTTLAGVENSWKSFKNRLLETTNEICRWRGGDC